MKCAAAALELADGQRQALEVLASSASAPHREVVRTRVLLAAGGVANARTANGPGCRP